MSDVTIDLLQRPMAMCQAEALALCDQLNSDDPSDVVWRYAPVRVSDMAFFVGVFEGDEFLGYL